MIVYVGMRHTVAICENSEHRKNDDKLATAERRYIIINSRVRVCARAHVILPLSSA